MTDVELVGERYQLVRELGSGGMGRVFAARDRALARDVAVKRMHDRLIDADSVARFEREARTAGSLSHPNIVTVFDIGWDNGRPFLVSELLEGTTLRELLANGALAEKQIVGIAIQLARGLAAAHACKVVHRDLKPANVFMTASGQVKLLDFGIAKRLRESDATSGSEGALSTDFGRALGTAGYMAPEQVRGQPVVPRSDIFSFGVVLHEMITGKRLFQRASPVETGYAIISEEAPALPVAISPGLERVTRACLRKNIEERPTASQLVSQLEELAGETPSANQTPLATAPIVRVSSRRLLTMLSLAALLALVVILVAVSFRARPRVVAGTLAGPVAVLPFNVDGDVTESYLAEGAVDLLNGAFGSAGLRTISSRRVLRESSHGGEAREIARRAGAAAYVIGSARAKGKELRLEAELHDASDGSIHKLAAVEGEVARPLDALAELASQLSLGLRAVGDGAVAPSQLAKVASVSTRSVPALTDWLQGESLLRRNDWNGAREAFRRATTSDPGFALAQYRLAQTAALHEPGLAADAIQAALVTRAALSPHDRALVEAFADFLQGKAARAEAEYRAIIANAPDDVEALYQLGEVLFHWNPMRGRSASEAEAVFNRVLVLDPEQGPALTHLIDLAQLGEQRSLVLALSERLLAVEHDNDAVAMLPIEWVHGWAAGNPAPRPELLTALRTEPAALPDVYTRASRAPEGLTSARQLMQILVDNPAPVQQSYGNFFLAVLELASGRPDAARARLDRAEQLTHDQKLVYYSLWLESVPFIPVNPERLHAARERVVSWDLSRNPRKVPWRGHLAGLLALRDGDFAAARREADALAKLPDTDDSLAADLSRELNAEIFFASGDNDAAAHALDSMHLRIPYIEVNTFAHAEPGPLRARIFARQGRDADALGQLALGEFYDFLAPAFFAPNARAAAELLERKGDVPGAIRELKRFISLWSDCEPALKPQVDDARRRLGQLEAR